MATPWIDAPVLSKDGTETASDLATEAEIIVSVNIKFLETKAYAAIVRAIIDPLKRRRVSKNGECKTFDHGEEQILHHLRRVLHISSARHETEMANAEKRRIQPQSCCLTSPAIKDTSPFKDIEVQKGVKDLVPQQPPRKDWGGQQSDSKNPKTKFPLKPPIDRLKHPIGNLDVNFDPDPASLSSKKRGRRPDLLNGNSYMDEKEFTSFFRKANSLGEAVKKIRQAYPTYKEVSIYARARRLHLKFRRDGTLIQGEELERLKAEARLNKGKKKSAENSPPSTPLITPNTKKTSLSVNVSLNSVPPAFRPVLNDIPIPRQDTPSGSEFGSVFEGPKRRKKEK